MHDRQVCDHVIIIDFFLCIKKEEENFAMSPSLHTRIHTIAIVKECLKDEDGRVLR